MPTELSAAAATETAPPVPAAATTASAAAQNGRFLAEMLDRLYATLSGGPSLNCRPHSSRQRIDLAGVAELAGETAAGVIARLLLERKPIKLTLRSGELSEPASADSESSAGSSEASEAKPKSRGSRTRMTAAARREQQSTDAAVRKLRAIEEDADTYVQDTGAWGLFLGWPLLSLPPSKRNGAVTRRVLAPIALVPISLSVTRGRSWTVELETRERGSDLVVPNTALLAWLRRQTGRPLPELYADEEGRDPLREINEIAAAISGLLELPAPEPLTADAAGRLRSPIVAAPKTEDAPPGSAERIVSAAVLGLFPASNQSLIDDVEALAAGEVPLGPVQAFLRVDPGPSVAAEPDPESESELESPTTRPLEEMPPARPDQTLLPWHKAPPIPAVPPQTPAPGPQQPTANNQQPTTNLAQPTAAQLVTLADPCQARAVRQAQSTDLLVVHGPPGTGKSQTIANVIGDHLAAGKRVLLVCDKRTALDVVRHRLERIGLGGLCAVVHDASADQRALYLGVREQLDGLAELRTDAEAAARLATLLSERRTLHAELSRYVRLLHEPPTAGELAFHDLVGARLELESDAALPSENLPSWETLPGPTVLEGQQRAVRETLARGAEIAWPSNPWRAAAAELPLGEFLARSMAPRRAEFAAAVAAARTLDGSADVGVPELLADADAAAITATAAARADFAEELDRLCATAEPGLLRHWAGKPADVITAARASLAGVQPFLDEIAGKPLDAELLPIHRADPLRLGQVAEGLRRLDEYLTVVDHWYGWFCFTAKREAAETLSKFGLSRSAANAVRLREFLRGVRARLTLWDAYDNVLSPTPLATAARFDDAAIRQSFQTIAAVLAALHRLGNDAALAEPRLGVRVRAALADSASRAELLRGLRTAPTRAAAGLATESATRATGLLAEAELTALRRLWRAGGRLTERLTDLESRLSTLEGVLRIRAGLAELPGGAAGPLGGAVRALLDRGVGPDEGWAALRGGSLSAEITRRLRAAPELTTQDASRLRANFDRLRQLDEQARPLTAAAILHQWTARQRQRLLTGTGSRLNSLGAELRRRLMLRGERAMRLRQVLAAGAGTDGGDPIFDLRPVWMAAPSTVAQIFPRAAAFDVVVFDEASQCRLEEALPVLIRGKRVVIAGDPRQLPPTRFFEAARSDDTRSDDSSSDDADEPPTDQQLFESQQARVDDLLTAALNLSVEQTYLDVHYRSRSGDLIEFSNRHFYDRRLQPIPGRPTGQPSVCPVRLHAVGGVYDKRANAAEAAAVVAKVRELLALPSPPSVGIACFNLVQRDAITDGLDEAAASDEDFAGRLREARHRQGTGSFEGLFVKNLENVQGDERDVMLISTTYGPDRAGKFRRNFGPLGMPGGGRRLNVLVTRARQEVHLFTSIPAAAYRVLPAVPEGAVPNGGWLLLAYLKFAEELAEIYGTQNSGAESSGAASAAGAPRAAAASAVELRPSEFPTRFGRALAHRLARSYGVSSIVHWGNDGFCVDVALRPADQLGHSGQPVLGLLCDSVRYDRADDPVEWDLFRTGILESQGWRLHRLWSPHWVRDSAAALEAVLAEARLPRL